MGLSSFFQFSSDPMLLCRIDGTIIDCNPAWEKHLGYSLASTQDRALLEFVTTESQEPLRQFLSLTQTQNEGEQALALGLIDRQGGLQIFTLRAQLDTATNEICATLLSQDSKTSSLSLDEEHRTMLLMKGSPGGLWDWNILTGEILFSPKWKEILGYAPAEVPDSFESWFELIHPDDAKVSLQTLRNYLEGLSADYRIEHRLRMKNGDYRWVISLGACLRDDRGHASRMSGWMIDVHAHHATRERLRQSEAQLQALTHTLPGVIFQMKSSANGELTLQFLAPNAADLFELPFETLRESPWAASAMIPPADRAELYSLAQDAAARMNQLHWQGGLVLQSGTIKWCSIIATPRADVDGGIIWDGIALDMTSEREARLLMRQMMTVLEASPDMVGVSDATGRVTYMNRAFRERSTLRVGDFTKEKRSSFYPAWAYKRIEEEGVPKAQESGYWKGESAIVDQNGVETPVSQVLAVGKNEAGEIEFMMTVCHDISEIREKERLLREQQAQIAAQSRLASLGEMAGGIAHEINNPLSIVLAYAERLRESALGEEGVSREQVLKSADKIEKTALRISKIVTGLRTVARDGSGDSFECVSAEAILNETLGLCAEKLSKQSIELIVGFPPVPLEFECRLVQICQVLLNLIVNAQHAIEKLPQKWIQVSVRDLGESVELRVTDSGCGIPTAVREKIFDPFFTTKEVGKGTGLGLSISVGLIKAHNGSLFIDTKSPHTSFVIQLPKKQTGGALGQAAA